MSDWRGILDELVRSRGRALFGYAYVLTGNREEAQDLLQDALVRAFRGGRTATSIDAAHVYVKRAIATAFIDRARRTSARPMLVAGEEDAGASAFGANHATATDVALDLQSVLLTLPPRERARVVLRYLEDLRVDQVADILGIAPGSVKRYLHDGIVRLREAMPELEFGAEEPAEVRLREGGVR